MAGRFNKKIILSVLLLLISKTMVATVTLNRNDPMPIFTTLDPHEFLYSDHKDKLKGKENFGIKERFNLSITPYIQTATEGRNADNDYGFIPEFLGSSTGEILGLLGDIPDRINMLGLLSTPTPTQATYPIYNNSYIACTTQATPQEITINPDYNDPSRFFGCFSVPIKYQKAGVRFQASARLFKGFGIMVKSGVSNVKQTIKTSFPLAGYPGLLDLTQSASSYYAPNKTLISENLMMPTIARDIAREIGYKIQNYSRSHAEDVYLSAFWSHPFPGNENEDPKEFAKFLFVPFAVLEGSVAVDDPLDPGIMFAVPIGNNGHDSLGGRLGFDFEFFETMQIGIDVGGLHFFSKDRTNYPVPNTYMQSRIYPFRTDVTIEPGPTWQCTVKLAARHFLAKTSAHVEYSYVNHQKDKITLKDPTKKPFELSNPFLYKGYLGKATEFLPEVLENGSRWSSHLLTAALNYDISKHMGAGILAQIPLTGKSSYKSWTWAGSVYVTF